MLCLRVGSSRRRPPQPPIEAYNTLRDHAANVSTGAGVRLHLNGRGHRYLNIFPSRKAMAKARDAIRELTRPQRCFMPAVSMIEEINQWQRGWTNYFHYGYPRVAFRAIHTYTVEKLTTHLQRRSQRAYRPPVGKSYYAHVHDLGLRRP